MVKLRYSVLVLTMLVILLAGCAGPGLQPVPTDAGAGTAGASGLDASNEFALGTLLLEDTELAVTEEQASALLPLWQAVQGGVLESDLEVQAVLRQIERTMVAEQVATIAAMQLSGEDLQSWAGARGAGLGQAGVAGATDLSEEERTARRATRQAMGGGQGGQGGFGDMSEEEGASMRATAQASGLFPGNAGGGTRPAGRIAPAGPVGALVQLLGRRAGVEVAQVPAPTAATPVQEADPAPSERSSLAPATVEASPTATLTPTPLPTAEATATEPPTPVPEATATPASVLVQSNLKPASTAEPEFAGKLVFQTAHGGDFYTINADGGGLTRITDGIDPVWSPDGQQIAFVRWREPRGVWVVKLDDSGQPGDEWRVFDWSETRWPAWSPDGSEILFSRQHSGGKSGPGGQTSDFSDLAAGRPRFGGRRPAAGESWKLGVSNLWDGAFWEPICSDTSLAPDWSPSGDQFVYDDVYGLTIQTVDGSVSYQLTQDAHDTSPVWSPAGDQVAFMRRQHDHWELYVVDADGGNLTRLTETPLRPNGTPGSSVSPAWSPGGQHIAFYTDRSGQWEIWVTAAPGGVGGDPQPMFDTELDTLTLDYAYVAERAISWTW